MQPGLRNLKPGCFSLAAFPLVLNPFSVFLSLLGVLTNCPTREHIKQVESVGHFEVPFGMTFSETIGGIVMVATVENEWLCEYAGFEKG